MAKAPCRVCGKVTTITGHPMRPRRWAHKCPHGQECIGSNSLLPWCPQCKAERGQYYDAAASAEYEHNQAIAKQMKRPEPASENDLLKVLTRYEGAVNECEVQGNESAEAVQELEQARAALMDLLKQAKVTLEGK